MRIGYGLTAMSVVSALSIFHDRFSISNSNWACWYSNCRESDEKKTEVSIHSQIDDTHQRFPVPLHVVGIRVGELECVSRL